MTIALLRRPIAKYWLICVLLILGYLLLNININSYDKAQILSYSNLESSAHESLRQTDQKRDHSKHLNNIFDVYKKYSLDIKLDNYKNGNRAQAKGFDDKLPVYSNKELGEFLQVSDEDLTKIKTSHAHTLSQLPNKYPDGLFRGRGIVTVAGGTMMPVVVGTVKMLRRVSPHLPVEVFVANKEEYESDICETVLPELNAKCRILTDFYGDDLWKKLNVRSYQLKSLAMLASSFEENLFLDSDSIPIADVEAVFDQDPYRSTGYVLWPDFWYRTTSPKFYNAAGIQLGKRVRGDLTVSDPDLIPQADLEHALPDKSTESGQIFFNKRSHYKALLLSVYYNLNGYSVYYPLLSQGCLGEGDKETFLAALEVLKQPYYSVRTGVRPSGYFDGGGFHGTGMLQVNPLDDYMKNFLKISDVKPRIMFMHLNFPKMNPSALFYSDEFAKFYRDDHSRVRFLGDSANTFPDYHFRDIELELWQIQEWVSCELGQNKRLKFKTWIKNDINISDMCLKTTEHISWLQSHPINY